MVSVSASSHQGMGFFNFRRQDLAMDVVSQVVLIASFALFTLLLSWCALLVIADCCTLLRYYRRAPPPLPPAPPQPAPVWYRVHLSDGTVFWSNSPICLLPSCPATAHSEFAEIALTDSAEDGSAASRADSAGGAPAADPGA